MPVSVGDALQITRFAWDLYNKGFIVARDAPEDFRGLLEQLLLLKDVLWIVQSKVDKDREVYGDHTRRILEGCFVSLSKFQVLIAKYEKLGMFSAIASS